MAENEAPKRRTVFYSQYLKSPEWKQLRERKIVATARRCQVCNSLQGLDVHHRTYSRLGREWDSDLTVLCRRCHAIYHATNRLPKAAKGPVQLRLAAGGRQRVIFMLPPTPTRQESH